MVAKEKIYKQTQVNTSNPLSILIMLYEKAIQDLKVAKELIKDGNWQNAVKANEKIFHAQEIITELMSTLNFEQGGNISTNLLSIYLFLNKELENVLLKKEIHKIDNVIKQLQILNFTWKELRKKENNVTQGKLGINIVS